MGYSYSELLARMKDKFTQESGLDADEAGDIGIRLRVLAGELYSLNTELDWIRRQMFPNTATGEQLDLHAQQRGLTRRKGQKAGGAVTFMLDSPLEYELTIPAGTVCTTLDGSLNYITVSDATIIRSSLYAYANVKAEETGEKYNSGPNSIKNIVTYFSVGISIAASSDMWGGTNDEDDESLRERIMESMRNTPDGVNAAFYEAVALGVEGVQSAKACRNTNQIGGVIIYIGGRGEAPSQATIDQVQQAIDEKTPLGVVASVRAASLQNVSVSVSIGIADGLNSSSVISRTKTRIRQFFDEMSVGEGFIMSALGKVIMEVDGVVNYSYAQGSSDVGASYGTLIKLQNLTVVSMS